MPEDQGARGEVEVGGAGREEKGQAVRLRFPDRRRAVPQAWR